MDHLPEQDLAIIAKGWNKARLYSLERLKRICALEGEQLAQTIKDGGLVLETVCLFVHACIKQGQYSLPRMFWHGLYTEYGIVVYPSALTEPIVVNGLGETVTYTQAYSGHVAMYGRCPSLCHPPPCPMEWIQEPPPKYQP
ncbi:hypothetical protein L249_4671 [Ophiocordyceps polyrhachis-furcata BCC 54312]|uniref:Uncharacterized protein n=1 Tax=Ophiocordyceps polyrhachis-furcata BCC 54312 TaxID=1330021 RepID=A0A367L327_9HYPO|nr:hypothetical protein L249_4671 [Ophiocordyceps polyrhachis-furcata BCC 54312]